MLSLRLAPALATVPVAVVASARSPSKTTAEAARIWICIGGPSLSLNPRVGYLGHQLVSSSALLTPVVRNPWSLMNGLDSSSVLLGTGAATWGVGRRATACRRARKRRFSDMRSGYSPSHAATTGANTRTARSPSSHPPPSTLRCVRSQSVPVVSVALFLCCVWWWGLISRLLAVRAAWGTITSVQAGFCSPSGRGHRWFH